MIAHVVLFSPKTDVSIEQRRSLARCLRTAREEIRSIKRAFVGRNFTGKSDRTLNLGEQHYEYAAVIEFDDREGLLDYLNHPRHEELGSLFWELCESTAIIDVEELGWNEDVDRLLVEQ